VKPKIQTVSSRFNEAGFFAMLVACVALLVRLDVSGYWLAPGLAICSAVTDAVREMNVIQRYTVAARYLYFM